MSLEAGPVDFTGASLRVPRGRVENLRLPAGRAGSGEALEVNFTLDNWSLELEQDGEATPTGSSAPGPSRAAPSPACSTTAARCPSASLGSSPASASRAAPRGGPRSPCT
ncbi:unnamed protein product [Prorocentrum cordatum]|uniref:Uncharacterized protein n=1 Tax=Prorocentrum cordatum TaxID=2364126 RepID=A0ABN9T5F4_9DINO|nr:unnamed protein product [Polarella glacialis]